MPSRATPSKAFDPASPAACKRLVAQALVAHGLANRLTARTIGFEDLGHGSMVFVQVHDWAPDPFFETLRAIGHAHGFRVEGR